MQEDSAGAAEDGGGAGAPLTVQPRGQDEGAPLDQLGYQPPARPCVLILGQEVPAEAAGSCTQALISELVSELSGEGREIAGDTLAAIAQQYEDDKSFGPNSLRALTERFYASGRQCPSEVHRRLAKLPVSLILTTCYDGLLSSALRDAGKKPLIQRFHLRGDKRDNPEFELPMTPERPLVYHLFGVPQEPNSLILSWPTGANWRA